MFIWVLLKLELDWEQAARRNIEDLLKKGDRMLDRTLLPTSDQFTGGEPLLRRSDRTLKQNFPHVLSDGGSAFDQAKVIKAVWTRLWLRLTGVHRTRPVMIPGDLDLSRIDRTLGASVRSLPPERPVS